MASRLTSQAILNGQRGLATQAATAKKSAAGSKAQVIFEKAICLVQRSFCCFHI